MKRTDVTEYTVETEKFGEGFAGFRFVLMSDLHSNRYGIDLHGLNQKVRAAKPDAVLIAGDMFNGKKTDDPGSMLRYLAALAGHYPVFFALGNHEYRMKQYTDIFGERYYRIRERLSAKGVVFLEDETATLEKDGERLRLSGVEIDSCFYKKQGAPRMGGGLMDKHLGASDRRFYNLLLAHNPDYFHRYAEWGADLILSGHLHGGIVRVPGIGGLVSTTGFILPEYDGGMYHWRNSLMLVSRGLGAHTLPVRINNPPELVVLKILAKNGL